MTAAVINDGFGQWPGRIVGWRADGLVLFQYANSTGFSEHSLAVPRHMISGPVTPPKPDAFTRAAPADSAMTVERFEVLDLLIKAGTRGLTDDELPSGRAIEERRSIERAGLCTYEGAQRATDGKRRMQRVHVISRAGRMAHRAWQLTTVMEQHAT